MTGTCTGTMGSKSVSVAGRATVFAVKSGTGIVQIARIRFNDVFALVIWFSIIASFFLHGAGVIKLPESVMGALVVIAQTVVFHYFRKRPKQGESGT